MKKLYPKLYRQFLKWHDLINKNESQRQLMTDSKILSPIQLKILESLGHRVPMSYKQAYVFYKDLFLQADVYAEYEGLQIIHVLVMNSCFGADLFGLIHAFNDCFDQKQLVIYCIEKEEEVLAFQESILKDWIKPRFKRHHIQVIPLMFDLKSSLGQLNLFLSQQQVPNQVELIHSFYVLGEEAPFKPTQLSSYFSFIKTHLAKNKLAVIVERSEQEQRAEWKPSVPYYLLNGWIKNFKAQEMKEKLYALTPIPCISRAMTERWHTQCANCNNCGVLIETYNRHELVSEKVFVMHLTTRDLYQKLKPTLFNNQVLYETETNDRFNASQCCALNAQTSTKKVETKSAFFLSLHRDEKEN